MSSPRKGNVYATLIEQVFFSKFREGDTEVPFHRDDIVTAAEELGLSIPKNLGDVVYSIRYRSPIPGAIKDKAPEDHEWIIRGKGRAKYAFDAVPNQVRIVPTKGLVVTKIPDATPEIIRTAAQGDEQALLALLRYNRLIDIFLGVTSYSLQNHLRTTVPGIGQVEVDEIYVAINTHGQQFIIPVQAKGGTDEIGITQTEQDLAMCDDKWPDLTPRPVSAQFMENGTIALFELAVQDDQVRLLREAHYSLVASSEISPNDLVLYKSNSQD